MMAENCILFVPGKNPKPPAEEHRRQLLRCLLRGVARADPGVAEEIEARAEAFKLVSWNWIYYRCYKSLAEDLSWINTLLDKTGPTRVEIKEALSWRRKFARLLYGIADRWPALISLLPDPAVRATIRETERYFADAEGIAGRIRVQLKQALCPMLSAGSRILLIGHSMGSVIAYDTLWELWWSERDRRRIDLFLSLGSPLGLRITQHRLLGATHTGAERFPGNIGRWVNIAAQGDLTALDASLGDDFKPMQDLGLIESIKDINGGVFNYFRNEQGLNVHRSYGYLVNPRVGEVIARWWKEH